MWVSRYFVLFAIFSCFGWIYETIYVTVKTGKWDNRGFLFGPVCPIYGAGGVGIGMVFDYLQSSGMAQDITWWQIFLISYIGSIVLEFPTHWILEKKFHAYWWDYSNAPLNIQGRICVPASIGFGCAGLLIYYILYPAIAGAIAPIPGYLLEVLSLMMMAFLAGDTALTVAALTNIVRSLEHMEEMIDRQMESVVDDIEYRKNEVENAFAHRRELLTMEHMEQAVKNMDGIRRGALSRIRGFKPRVEERHHVSHERLKKLWAMAKENRR